jgi:hypothetical protein
VDPAALGPSVRAGHRFTDLLGQDHDLAVLQTVLEKDLQGNVAVRTYEQIKKLVAPRRVALQREARELGKRLYAEGEDEFMSRVHRYWKKWRRGHH